MSINRQQLRNKNKRKDGLAQSKQGKVIDAVASIHKANAKDENKDRDEQMTDWIFKAYSPMP